MSDFIRAEPAEADDLETAAELLVRLAGQILEAGFGGILQVDEVRGPLNDRLAPGAGHHLAPADRLTVAANAEGVAVDGGCRAQGAQDVALTDVARGALEVVARNRFGEGESICLDFG